MFVSITKNISFNQTPFSFDLYLFNFSHNINAANVHQVHVEILRFSEKEKARAIKSSVSSFAAYLDIHISSEWFIAHYKREPQAGIYAINRNMCVIIVQQQSHAL